MERRKILLGITPRSYSNSFKAYLMVQYHFTIQLNHYNKTYLKERLLDQSIGIDRRVGN